MVSTEFNLRPEHQGDLLAAASLQRSELESETRLRLVETDGEATIAGPDGLASDQVIELGQNDSYLNHANLDDWFAPQTSPELANFHRGSAITPFINGPAYFGDLFSELERTTFPPPDGTPVPLFYLTGLSIDHLTNFVPAANGLANRSVTDITTCLLYTSPSPRDRQKSRMPSSA